MSSITIVLIPGLMNDGEVWAAQVGPLSRLGAVHLPCNDGPGDLAVMAARIVAATAGPLAVVGHSMGGRIALELAVRAPARLAGLALLSTGTHGAPPDESDARARLVELARREGMAAVAAAWLPNMVAPTVSTALRDRITAMLYRASPEAFAAQQQALLARPDRTAALADLACPVLIATGALDGWSPPQQHARIAAAIADARLAIIPDAGHMLPMEAPDVVADLLAEFVQRCCSFALSQDTTAV